MKIYLKTNVFDEALNRVRRIFDEFEEVIVSFSGGKDSTVVLNLALIVAKEKNKLPLKVMFIDQEAEWQSTNDYVKKIMHRPDVDPMWLQIPFRLSNSTTNQAEAEWLHCWDVNCEEKWIRPKDEVSIKENVYGVDRFSEIFYAVIKHHFPDKKTASIGGVRADESPTRYLALTSSITYKDITWGKKDSEKDFVFYPIYDWTWQDVWTAIHKNKWDYNDIYNQMYRFGESPSKMRVSSLCHETSIKNIYLIQEIEKDNWNRLCDRIQGFNTVSKLDKEHLIPKELPFMFDNWKEYRDYLVEKLISDSHRPKFKAKFERLDVYFAKTGEHPLSQYFRECVKNVLRNDIEFTTLSKFETRPESMTYKNWQKGRVEGYETKLITIHKELYGDDRNLNTNA